MAFSSVKSYPVSVANQDIPTAWLSNSDARVASASKKIVSISSQNGTQTSGGQMTFVLPSNMGSGMLASGSAYLKFTVTVTQPTAVSWAYKQYGSASSVINRMTLLASGAITEQILNYNKLYSSLLLHASNPSFASGDDALNQYSFAGAFTTSTTSTVVVPIMLGAFNSKQHFPLFLLNSAQLNIDLDTVVNALTSSVNQITEYSVSSATLCFEQIIPDHQFEMSVKQMLGTRLFQMPINTWYNVRVAQSGAVTQNIGLNCSSLRGVLWNTVVKEAGLEAGHFESGGQTSCRLYLDGQLAFNGNLDTSVQQFIEMNRSLNTAFDSDRVSVGVNANTATQAVAGDFTIATITRANYVSGAYLGGLSTSKSSDSGFSFVGMPVNTAVLEFVGSSGGTFYIYCALQQIIAIDGQGNASLIR
jgi:hypothetical protein